MKLSLKDLVENGPDIQKHCCKRNFQAATISQISIVNTKKPKYK